MIHYLQPSRGSVALAAVQCAQPCGCCAPDIYTHLKVLLLNAVAELRQARRAGDAPARCS